VCHLIRYCLFVLITLLSLNGVAAKKKPLLTIEVTVPSDVYSDYLEVVKYRNPIEITNYTHPYNRRDVVELILLQQALALGGLQDYELEFIVVDSYLRSLRLLESGKALMTGTSLWSQDITNNDSLSKSAAIIKVNEFEAGLYTNEKQYAELTSKPFVIQDLTVVSSKQWTVDWQSLKKIDFKYVLETNSWDSMVKMVDANRANILLAPFQATPDMSFEVGDVTFKPLPNLKIGLLDSRHFAISKKHPHFNAVFIALEKGLKVLEEEGVLIKAYTQSGFMNVNVRDWSFVN